MKNKLSDLNDYLFCQLERLNDESLKGDDLKQEIDRGHAISEVATNIVKNAAIVLKAHELRLEYGLKCDETPKLLSLQ